jgi:hypothetical protein
MERRTRASLLWGAVGGLSFLVLVQAWRLLGGEPVTTRAAAGAAVVAAAGAAVLAYLAEGTVGGADRRQP